jgi:uncharacterized membrane protein
VEPASNAVPKLDERFHLLGGMLRIVISLGIGILFVALIYQVFGVLSLASKDTQLQKPDTSTPRQS